MGYHGFDLVYELQVELGWEKEFAIAARNEYMRYLQLRAKANDYQACKLTPSRVIAIVWNLHRQWTSDYERTCRALGAFIHHYPPAMRMGLPSEQAYANTVEMYKSHFNENPPDSYWGVPICSNKASSSNVDYLSTLNVPENAEAPLQPAAKARRRSPAIGSTRDDIVHVGDSNKQIPGAVGQTKSEAKPSKPKKSPGVSRVRHGYVLRPLPPGEKRKRGRPSMSEYIPVAQATSQLQEFVGNVAVMDGQLKPAISGAVSVPGRGSAAMLKSRRQQVKPHSAVVGAHDINGQAGSAVPGAPAMFKRPRGRPRKDGSWPIPRNRQEPPLKQKVEPVPSAETHLPPASEAQTVGTHSMGLPENSLNPPQENSGVAVGKEDGSAGAALGEGDMMDIGEQVQKQAEFVSTQPQVTPTHFVTPAPVPAGTPQLMESERDPATA
ncbi:hypothetical protein FGB62_82g073 [Gracilaria domingensis]|nr:hypothetical protein FGB62_82g073 [Gracilaria domingensis]